MLTVNVLGRDYTINFRAESEDAKLKECAGYCDYSCGEIVIAKPSDNVMNMRDTDAIARQNIRHELIHAFAHESGLCCNSSWAMDEEMTDWVAIQFPKMLAAFTAAGAMV